jgi:phosphoribosylanthranilate isomerase
MVRIKICGITNREDATLAVDQGADALGFIFAPSPRQVTPPCARSIINALPPFVQTVGVFVNEDPGKIREMVAYCNLDFVQLHGDERPDFCRELMPRVIKAIRLRDEKGLLPIETYQGKVRAILLDTYEKGRKGGTGRVFDWELAVKARAWGIPIILSGGLGPSNIGEAISFVRPYAVDINSGIETRPGIKDPDLMAHLMGEIHRVKSGGLWND